MDITEVMVYKGLSEQLQKKILVPIDYTEISMELLQKTKPQKLSSQALRNFLKLEKKSENGDLTFS